MVMPARPKIYHICHVDRLASIIASNGLLSDAVIQQLALPGTVVGMNNIKQRRLTELQLNSHPGLFVGQCVPFYFCPRSVMLYLIHRRNPELTYQGGQEPIIHLEADLQEAVNWANAQNLRWAFTLSNAGARYFEDRTNLAHLDEVNWTAVQARDWQGCKDGKQAEFLLERGFPFQLVERIGVSSNRVHALVANTLAGHGHRPPVEIKPDWYY